MTFEDFLKYLKNGRDTARDYITQYCFDLGLYELCYKVWKCMRNPGLWFLKCNDTDTEAATIISTLKQLLDKYTNQPTNNREALTKQGN